MTTVGRRRRESWPSSAGPTVGVRWLVLIAVVALLATACGTDGQPGAPSAHKVTPGIGREGDVTIVTIAGRNFSPGAKVRFGDMESSQPVFVDSQTIRTEAPPQERGRVEVVVTNPNGGASRGAITFRYVARVFDDVAASAGASFQHIRDRNLYNFGGGVAVADYNNDGHLDIYVANSAGPNALYRNNGDGTFEDVANGAGLAGPFPSANGVGWADYDNDGDLDLFISTFGNSRFYQNSGAPAYTFTDVTVRAGIGDPDSTHRTTGVHWGDYDGDGLLDLIAARHHTVPFPEAFRLSQDFSYITKPLSLHHNNGDGTFTNLTHLLGETTRYPSNVRGVSFKPSFVDYDNDGDPDIYVVNDLGELAIPNVLWRNDGPDEDGRWRFTDVSDESRAGLAMHGMGLAVGDYDNDEDLDFYVTNVRSNRLLRNEGDGTFSNRTEVAGVGRGVVPNTIAADVKESNIGWGTGFFDFDNDGLLDLYAAAGFLDTDPDGNPSGQPNVLFINNGDGTFDDISALSGADDPGIGRDAAFADFNEDGCVDIFLVNMGDESGTPGVARLFENTCDHGNSWLAVKPVGTVSNRDGIGARIRVTAGGLTQVREMGASQSHMSHSVAPVHFGLGSAATVDLVEVRWPNGRVRRLTDVPVNQRIIVTEP